ncbi:GAF and ANTAR domain-containing protein [Microlunatus endophyticus]|uniref:GAF and ANTAR domain-containing protein n=1 Tax=Microlunatus endophyticus TaxID=1716077 RepID=UPI001665E736|nr:GAF and ANTAR domain-containing protein [Microlunatus endophyticus]
MNSLKYAEDFAQLAEQLHAEHQQQPTLERIASLAVQAVDACDACGIILRERDGRLTTAAASDPIAAQAAQFQEDLGEGPSVDEVWELGTLTVNDLSSELRWPRWAPAAAELGVRSVLSLRLEITGSPLAASLNLFAHQPYAFDATDLGIASVFARHAASALAAAHVEEGLRAAARSRQIIGVAQGMLMQRFGLTLDQSFELLRRYSQTHNVKLRVLAETLAESGGIKTTGVDGAPADPAAGLDQAFGIGPDD